MLNNQSLEYQSLAQKEQNYVGKLIFQKMAVEDYMNDSQDGHPAVYVGTYRKYNDGMLFGMWVDMVKCGDYDTFMEVCHVLHADEDDPELMCQDFECFPEAWYSESGIDADTFDKIMEYAELEDECYNLDDMMGHLASYFDYASYAYDLFIDDFYFTDGYVFRR